MYDATVVFCNRFISRRSRTHDQMVQAARSGKQNIAEGSMASGTSKKTELKLIGVARASLEELLMDFQDYLRQKGLALWGKDHVKAKAVRGLCYKKIGLIRLISKTVLMKLPQTPWSAWFIRRTICLINN